MRVRPTADRRVGAVRRSLQGALARRRKPGGWIGFCQQVWVIDCRCLARQPILQPLHPRQQDTLTINRYQYVHPDTNRPAHAHSAAIILIDTLTPGFSNRPTRGSKQDTSRPNPQPSLPTRRRLHCGGLSIMTETPEIGRKEGVGMGEIREKRGENGISAPLSQF